MGGGGGGDNGMMMVMSIMMMQQMQQMQQQQMQQITSQQQAQAQKQATQVQQDVQANTWDMMRQYGQNNATTSAAPGNMSTPSVSYMPPSGSGGVPLLTQLASNPMTSTAPAAAAKA
jgi:hypothetical protein